MTSAIENSASAGASEAATDFAAIRVAVRHPGLTCIVAGLFAMAARILILPLIPIPIPTAHDEFSYLLGADTFASGRITNPPHPMWIHFETFHVNQQPTYCSKYPPAQSLFLAFGQKFLGHPWFGVWISMGMMFASLCWMLQGWLTMPYALLTTFMAIVEWGISSYWINSYWGGAIGATGGALVIGAIPRIAAKITVTPILLSAIGLVLLANSRPYEGILTAIAAAGVLVWRTRSLKRPLNLFFRPTVIVPFVLIILPSLIAMGYYNYRLTGSPTLFPYTVNQRTYAASPHLYVLPHFPTPVYHHEIIRKLWDWDRSLYLDAREDPIVPVLRSIINCAPFYFFNSLGLATLCVFFFGSPLIAPALAILSLPIFGLMIAKLALPHYASPAFGACMILAGAGLQSAKDWRFRGRNTGPWLLILFLALSFISCFANSADAVSSVKSPPKGIRARPAIVEELHRLGGRHLVIVRYSATHFVHAEWVYNRADIDGSEIVWARDMGDDKNQELIEYYQDREVWLLQPDEPRVGLQRFRRASAAISCDGDCLPARVHQVKSEEDTENVSARTH